MLRSTRLRCSLTTAALGAAATGALLAFAAGAASAHTEASYVAVPAGDEVTIDFVPTHGCAGSPTVAVSVRVPAPGAVAGDVAGFTSSAEADGDRTVLRWEGGVVPADADDTEFPITFTVPDRVGELLVFPTVQTCEVGEIAWIDGDPTGEYPAVRVLVLAAGSEPATSIDDVPADAPGRDLLTTVVDVDNPSATTVSPDTTTAPATIEPAPTSAAPDPAAADGTAPPAPTASSNPAAPATVAAAATTAEPAVTSAAPTTPASASTTVATVPEDDEGSDATPLVVGLIVGAVVIAATAATMVVRRRR